MIRKIYQPNRFNSLSLLYSFTFFIITFNLTFFIEMVQLRLEVTTYMCRYSSGISIGFSKLNLKLAINLACNSTYTSTQVFFTKSERSLSDDESVGPRETIDLIDLCPVLKLQLDWIRNDKDIQPFSSLT